MSAKTVVTVFCISADGQRSGEYADTEGLFREVEIFFC